MYSLVKCNSFRGPQFGNGPIIAAKRKTVHHRVFSSSISISAPGVAVRWRIAHFLFPHRCKPIAYKGCPPGYITAQWLSPRGQWKTVFFFHIVSWCEPSQQLEIISALKTNYNPSLSHSAHKSNISRAQLKYFTIQEHREKRRKLVVKSSVVPHRPQRFKGQVKVKNVKGRR